MPGTRKLGRSTDHRRAMMRAMVTYLLENGKIDGGGGNFLALCRTYFGIAKHLD